MKKANIRGSERILTDAVVKLSWSGASGEPHFARGKILDYSGSGLRIEVSERIQIRSYITLNAAELNRAGWAGWGSVRYCTAKRSKYVIGLELSGGAQWT